MADTRRSGCPDRSVLLGFLHEDLPEGDHEQFTHHLATCTDCALRLGRMQRQIRSLPQDFLGSTRREGQELIARLRLAQVEGTIARPCEEERQLVGRLARLIQCVDQWLPQFASRFSSIDLISLRKRLLALRDEMLREVLPEGLVGRLDATLATLQNRFPELAVAQRGEEVAVADTSFGLDDIERLSDDISQRIGDLDDLSTPQKGQGPGAWQGDPERQIFGALQQDMMERACRIRDWCEDFLEAKAAGSLLWNTPAHGIGHAKRVLMRAASLMQITPDFSAAPINPYLLYTSVFCREIGFALDDKGSSPSGGTMERVLTGHADKVSRILLGSPHERLAGCWRVMGFSSEQEAAIVARISGDADRRGDEYSVSLPASQAIFVDGKSTVCLPSAVAAILNLASVLCVPHSETDTLYEWCEEDHAGRNMEILLLQEMLYGVKITSAGDICIGLRPMFIYPPYLDAPGIVKGSIRKVFAAAREPLKDCGLTLTEPVFEVEQPLFLEEHPYLKE